uniref:HcA n=1 Tax=Scolopendra dehaani TaxID=2609776 RepID=A0A212MHU6_SCODE|nr:HcA [Scolopendra dehaani]
MRCFVLVLLIAATFASQCPKPPSDAEAKQQQIFQIVEYINKAQTPEPVVEGVEEKELKYLGHLPKNEIFSLFDERNWPEAKAAVKYLLEPKTFDDFIKAAKILITRINDEIFLYALSVAILHRPDTRGVQIPRIQDVFPDKFIPNFLLQQIREEAIRGDQNPIVNLNISSNYLNVENSLNYFTNDLGMNSHHYHYHVVHPATGVPIQTVTRDRHGSRFAHMHSQLVRRYESERLSSGLPLTESFVNWDEPIQTGFSSHLTIFKKSYYYNFRPEGITLSDLPELTKNKMLLWKHRILLGIHSQFLISANNKNVSLEREDGEDLLGNAVESSLLSINRQFYGNLHNYAHVIAGRASDPDGRYGAHNGVMHDVATSARDPLFYRWHKFIESLFQQLREHLKPYSHYELTYPAVVVEKVEVVPDKHPETVNKVRTGYTTNKLKLNPGFDFTRQSTATVNVQHLDHEPFHYKFRIYNNAQQVQNAAVRIFLAPKYDEQGHRLKVNDQRQLMIELDKFVVHLQPGVNQFLRSSSESSVTMPTKYFFGDVQDIARNHSCNCGWPEYLLLPRGSYEGLDFQLFVAVTNWDEDKVKDKVEPECQCSESLSYCGTISGKYPDRRPFGYPFERPIVESNWEDFVTQNIHISDVNIRFVGNVEEEKQIEKHH